MKLTETVAKILLVESVSTLEPFDEFDQIYLDNHRDLIKNLEATLPDQAPENAEDKEVYLFWSLHRGQISQRLSESVISESSLSRAELEQLVCDLHSVLYDLINKPTDPLRPKMIEWGKKLIVKVKDAQLD